MTSHNQNDHAPALDDLLRSYGLHLFYGDLHNHTAYSDGVERPADALARMRERGLHFAAITDHGELLGRAADAWDATHQAAALHDDGFVALRGFEWSSPRLGHSNVWCSAEHTRHEQTGDATMADFYGWLAAAQPTAGAQVLAQFNHPGREQGMFDDFAFVPALDERMAVVECFNRQDDYGAGYLRALDAGWHVGASGNADHHSDDWGGASWARTGVFAASLTRRDILAALHARRVFATRAHGLALLLTGNGAPMGARLTLRPGEPLLLGVWCQDPAASDAPTQLECWTSGGTLLAAHETRGMHELRWGVQVDDFGADERWFVVRVRQADETRAYSSPIWARRAQP